MAGVKNIYVRNGDEPFWAWAQEQADAQNIPLSTWLARMIQQRKYDVGSGQAAEPAPEDLLQSIRDKAEQALAMLLAKEPES